MTEIWEVVAATGHRPKDIPPADRPWVREKLGKAAIWLRDQRGTRVGISGMALLVDQLWAQAVLDAGLDLWAYIPFRQQPDPWPDEAKAEWQRLLDQAAKVHVTGDLGDTTGEVQKRLAIRLLHARNDDMIRDSGATLAVWNGKTSGGTYSAVRKSQAAGRPIVWINPATRTVQLKIPENIKISKENRK